jgi:hypothetical protein
MIRASGFVWPDANSVVTAYHVVADSGRVQVSYDDGATLMDAQVVKIYPKRDVALLHIDSPPASAAVIAVANGIPAAHTAITLIGFPQGWATRCPSTGFTVDQGLGGTGKTLGDCLQAGDFKTALNDLGFPDFTSDILVVQIPMLPGDSGGPVVDDQGELVGIAAGGLEKGLAQIDWAIPADALSELQNSDAFPVPVNSTSLKLLNNLFGAELDSDNEPAMQAGDIILTKLRTRTLAQLTQFNDDPLGLGEIVSDLTMQEAREQNTTPDINGTQNWKFDLYRVGFGNTSKLSSPGLILAVPHEIKISLGNDDIQIKADTTDDDLTWVAQLKKIFSLSEAATDSNDFESDVRGPNTLLNWILDPKWSYPVSRMTNQGVTIRRLALAAYPDPASALAMGVPSEYVNMVHAAYQKTYLGVALSSLNNGRMVAAVLNPALRTPDTVAHHQLWAKFVLATMMCGIPATDTLSQNNSNGSLTQAATSPVGNISIATSGGPAQDAETVAKLLAQSDFNGVRAKCNAPTAQFLTDATLSQGWNMTVQMSGPFQAVDSVYTVRSPYGAAQQVKCTAAHGSILVTVYYDANNQIGGLWVAPGPP